MQKKIFIMLIFLFSQTGLSYVADFIVYEGDFVEGSERKRTISIKDKDKTKKLTVTKKDRLYIKDNSYYLRTSLPEIFKSGINRKIQVYKKWKSGKERRILPKTRSYGFSVKTLKKMSEKVLAKYLNGIQEFVLAINNSSKKVKKKKVSFFYTNFLLNSAYAEQSYKGACFYGFDPEMRFEKKGKGFICKKQWKDHAYDCNLKNGKRGFKCGGPLMLNVCAKESKPNQTRSCYEAFTKKYGGTEGYLNALSSGKIWKEMEAGYDEKYRSSSPENMRSQMMLELEVYQERIREFCDHNETYSESNSRGYQERSAQCEKMRSLVSDILSKERVIAQSEEQERRTQNALCDKIEFKKIVEIGTLNPKGGEPKEGYCVDSCAHVAKCTKNGITKNLKLICGCEILRNKILGDGVKSLRSGSTAEETDIPLNPELYSAVEECADQEYETAFTPENYNRGQINAPSVKSK